MPTILHQLQTWTDLELGNWFWKLGSISWYSCFLGIFARIGIGEHQDVDCKQAVNFEYYHADLSCTWFWVFRVNIWKRFPGYILGEYINETGHDSSSHDLASFNLNLGDFGKARLVACLDVGSTVGKSTIQVSLRCVLDESDESNKLREDEISIECCLIVINEDGELIHQV